MGPCFLQSRTPSGEKGAWTRGHLPLCFSGGCQRAACPKHGRLFQETDGYKAYAVSYMLCKRYGVDAKEYEISKLDGVFQAGPQGGYSCCPHRYAGYVQILNGRMAGAMGLTRDSKQKEQER
ncbi:MAG: hypothetical protein ACLRJV_23195 [Eubacteriales bacterium]